LGELQLLLERFCGKEKLTALAAGVGPRGSLTTLPPEPPVLTLAPPLWAEPPLGAAGLVPLEPALGCATGGAPALPAPQGTLSDDEPNGWQ